MLLFGPTLMVGFSWLLGDGRLPSDMRGGILELLVFLLIIGAVPSILLSFGVMAPLTVLMDRVAGGRTSRSVNFIAGILVGLAGLAALLWGGSQLAWQPGESFWQVAVRPFMVRLEAAAIGVPFFVLVGMTIAAGMRHRTRTAI
jgi:hypothetical protein